MQKNILPITLMTIIIVILSVLLLFSFQGSRKLELEFNEKKATLVKENLDLKDRLDSMQQQISQKTQAVLSLEEEKGAVENNNGRLKKQYENKISSYLSQIEALNRHKKELKKKIESLEKVSIVDRMIEAAQSPDNANIKKILDFALGKIELIKAGKNVDLEPIVVTKQEKREIGEAASEDMLIEKEAGAPQSSAAASPVSKKGVILTVDPANSFIVTSLGRKDDVKEGDRCRIMKNGEEIASARVMNVRYRVAAAFVDDIKFRYSINDIKEGLKVFVEEKGADESGW